MALGLDLAELARHLKQERLFVSSEREQLTTLYEQVKTVAEQLNHDSWITREQKSIMDALIRSSREVTPAECCSRTNQLESSNFVDGYKHLSYHDSKYGEFFKFLRGNPRLLGQIVSAVEHVNQGTVPTVVKIIMHSVFGNCVLQEDEMFVLQMLKCLLELQLATCDNPRRMLRRGSSSFSIAFKQFFDTVFSAKLFLTAALHDPVMRLLMEDEWFYDIDPDKALIRFPPVERMRRFGDPGTEEYKTKLQRYRSTIVDKLVTMASRFISSIKNNMHCFPPSLGWLASQVYHILTKTSKMSMSEVRAICADLVFALFICPAICDPEPHGITTDVPISHIARHNLMQIAQIIQVLAISQPDDIDPKVQDLYSKFDKGCMSSLLDSLLDGLGPELPLTASSQLPCLMRTSVLIRMSQLNTLIGFLRSAVAMVDQTSERKCLEDILLNLPPITPVTPTPGSLNSLLSTTPTQTPPGTPMSSKKHGKKKSIVPDDGSGSRTPPESESQPSNHQIEDVLVIALGVDTECPGMISEQKVLTSEQENRRRRIVISAESQEKRTRFSLSHDQESIGNTSDIPEAISEGASSHSVASQDLENDDNDNFSDMISANVSGRGTPNISGRDTPLSQAESMEQENNTHPQPPALPETVQKNNREDVTDRFGKFDIKSIGEFECDDFKSTVSDTWSIDVLASDSEPPEQNQHVRLEEIAEEMVRQNLLGTQDRVAEISETASDAWSTDVLASDTDEKQMETLSEFDQDDMSSVTEFSTNMDDVQSEADGAEGTEVTPMASGVQSPNENSDINPSRSVQGKQLPRKTGYEGSPPLSDNVFGDNEDDTALNVGPRNSGRPLLQPHSTGLDNSKLFVPIKGKKPAPSPPSLFHDKGDFNGRRSSNGSPLASHSRSSLPDVFGSKEGQSFPITGSGSMAAGGVASSIVIAPESGARPKVPKLVNLSSDKEIRKKKDVSSFLMKGDGQSIPTNGDILRSHKMRKNSADSGLGSAQFAIDSMSEPSGDVKLMEQQNTNLDESRFSNALNLFDPLSPSSHDRGDLLEGAGSPSMTSFQDVYSPPPQNNINQSSSVDVLLSKSSGGAMADNTTAALNSQFEFPDSLNSLSSPVSSTTAVLQDRGTDVFFEDTVSSTPGKRRGSEDSSRSSGSSLSKDDSISGEKSERSSLDTSQNLDDKDLISIDDGSTPGKKKGLFKNLRDKLHKGMKPKTGKQKKDVSVDSMLDVSVDKVTARVAEPNIVITETSDDILEKYRPSSQKSILTSTPAPEKERHLTFEDDTDTAPLYDPRNLENCVAFLDAKRKLRMVLGSGDFQIGDTSSVCFSFGATSYSPRELDCLQKENNELVNLLRAQLSEAINLQNKDTIAQLHEALRCVRMFDADGCKKLVRSLQDDYQNRSSYISYLVRSKQGLLTTLSHLQRLLNRIRREKEICDKHMINVCVRIFLEARERNVSYFIAEFQKLTVSDEKTDHVEKFLQFLYQGMHRDQIWLAANDNQIDDAHLAIERYLMSRIYTHAMFPNGDGDILRDQLIQQHINKLVGVISPSHKDLRIPRMYHLECPWPAAQREIYMINAYKTPKDKLQCVLRCSTTIMNLLSMANEKSVPAADDFTPVLIYVIIQANPPCLLSTIQYINSFYQNRLQGEEQYWWMQFSAAVEFIKTMEYGS